MPLSVEPADIRVSAADILAWKHRLTGILLDLEAEKDEGTISSLRDSVAELRDWFEIVYYEGNRMTSGGT